MSLSVRISAASRSESTNTYYFLSFFHNQSAEETPEWKPQLTALIHFFLYEQTT